MPSKTGTVNFAIKGDKGDPGIGIKSITKYYMISSSSSGITINSSGWSVGLVTPTADKPYLWNYERIELTEDADPIITDPVIIGTYSKDGSNGRGISSITDYWALSTSGTTAPTSGWGTSLKTPDATNRYLWNYEIITYDDLNSTSTMPHVAAVYGDKGESGPEGPQGPEGQVGPSGPLVYPAGAWNSSTRYTYTDTAVPAVMYNDLYYILQDNSTTRAGLISSTNPAASAAANSHWKQFDVMKYVFTEVLFADFAKLASAIIYERYMFSQYGRDNNGNAIESEGGYMGFDYTDPLNNSASFKPNLLLDLLEGSIYARRGTFSGLIRKEATYITDANYSSYIDGSGYINLNKAGSLLVLTSEYTRQSQLIIAPSLWDNRQTFHREMAGQTLVIVNKTNLQQTICTENSCQILRPHKSAIFECKPATVTISHYDASGSKIPTTQQQENYSWERKDGELATSNIVTCKYNVTYTSTSTTLLSTSFDISQVAKMEIDGQAIDPISSYRFNTTGHHIVKLYLNQPTNLSYMFYGATALIEADISEVNLNICTSLRAMFYNTRISEIVIPASASNVSDLNSIFNFCSKLHRVEFRGPMPSAEVAQSNGMFYEVAASGTLVLNAEYTNYYQTIEEMLPTGWTTMNEYM